MARIKRANAGNRLQALLEDQAPLDDEDAKFFAEKEDDTDFDLEAEEERIKRERMIAAEKDDSESEESAGDSNFSDSSDDSDIENEAEPGDAGEKELIQEQRQARRDKKTAERNKMFKIKRRPQQDPENAVEAPPRKKKRWVFTSEDLINQQSRKSERKSALRNKEYLIGQMRAAEERRAQYVPPSRPKARKLTQEQRLEEAKRTEIRNLSTLNKFVELEEERKIQQRLAMLSRRPKLTQFVRYHSSSVLSPPKLVEVLYDMMPMDMPPIRMPPGMPMAMPPGGMGMVPGMAPGMPHMGAPTGMPHVGAPTGMPHMGAPTGMPHMSVTQPVPAAEHPASEVSQSEIERNTPENKETNGESREASVNAREASVETREASEEPEAVEKPEAGNQQTKDSNTETTDQVESEEPGEKPVKEPVQSGEKDTSPHKSENQEVLDEANSTKDEPSTVVKEEVKVEVPNGAVKVEGEAQVKQEGAVEQAVELIVEGPPHLTSFNFLTLHEFADVHLNKVSSRNIILGPIASNVRQPPLKRMCPFDGTAAKYLDPKTDVAYSGMRTNNLIKAVAANELGWSKELGGVFTYNTTPQRPAKGVPEGF